MVCRMRYSLLVFSIAFICLSCKKTGNSPPAQPAAGISTINCSEATTATATAGTAYTGTLSIPYSGGNGANYLAGSPIASTGVTGLTATLQAGQLASGSGSLIY